MTTILPQINKRYLPPQPPGSRLKNMNKNKKTIYKLINALPEELKMKIYKEYLEPEIYYSMYQDAIHRIESKKLNIKILRPILPILLSKPHVSDYLCKQCKTFRVTYSIHKTEKTKIFNQLNKGDSFVLSILFYLYH
jgi:hypothetical protein